MAAKAAGLKDIYDSIGKSIDLSVDSDGDGIPDYYEDNLVAFNGKRILTDKNNADTDGDGLSDGEEVEIKVKEYGKQAVVFGKYNSNPTSGDSDGDGLNDGNARYINRRGKTIKVAPKDMEPLKMNGHKRFWDAHVKSQQEGITSEYSSPIASGKMTHYAKVKAVDMNMSLYKYDTYSITNIVNWYPDDPQWWITGFSGARKEFRHPRAHRLFVIGHIRLGELKKECLLSFGANEYNQRASKYIVNDEDDSIWVYWDEFRQ